MILKLAAEKPSAAWNLLPIAGPVVYGKKAKDAGMSVGEQANKAGRFGAAGAGTLGALGGGVTGFFGTSLASVKKKMTNMDMLKNVGLGALLVGGAGLGVGYLGGAGTSLTGGGIGRLFSKGPKKEQK